MPVAYLVKVPVLTAGDGADWESAWVFEFERHDHGIAIARRCVDVVELLAVAEAGLGRAALVAPTLRRLDADAVDRLLVSDIRPIGVVPRDDVVAENRVRALGIEHLVPHDADPAIVASVVLEAISAPAAAARAGRALADPLAAAMAEPVEPGAAEPSDGPAARNGSVIAVWGPGGAPGRTTLAVLLADEIARLGAQCLLVDADVYGGVVASVLGLLDESPGLAAACRVAGTTRLDEAALARLCWQISPGLRVLTGIPLSQRWPEIRASAIPAVLAAARTVADVVVIDCGFAIEADEELSFDTLAPRRNGATLAVLDAADTVLVVGTADPIGMQRLIRGLADLAEAEIGTPARVILNKVRRVGAGRSAGADAVAALRRFAGRDADAVLPYDLEALDLALLKGRTLGEIQPGSPLRQAVVSLARTLTGIESRSERRRRRG